MAEWEVGGYTYYTTKREAENKVKSSDDVVAFEGGLGWYVHSKKEYAMAIKVVNDLASREHLTKTQSDYFESLANNIMVYESKKMKIEKTNPIEMLRFLLTENGLTGLFTPSIILNFLSKCS